MIGKSKSNCNYVGPKALFDPDYIPPTLLYRKNEENTLYSILKDSLNDQFSITVLYQGLQGIGKKVIINKVLKDMYFKNDFFSKVVKIYVDCNEKDALEVLQSLLLSITKQFNFQLFCSNNSLPSKGFHRFDAVNTAAFC